MPAGRPALDVARAATFVGKSVLIGVSYLDRTGSLVAQRQWFGWIADVSVDGIVVRLEDSAEACVLPPDLRAFRPAEPGTYRLRHTGRVIADPDLITTWTHRETRRETTEFVPPTYSPDWAFRSDDPPVDSGAQESN